MKVELWELLRQIFLIRYTTSRNLTRPIDTSECFYALSSLECGSKLYQYCVYSISVLLVALNFVTLLLKNTRILVGPDSVCRQYHTSSATLSVSLSSGGATNTSRINWRPCVRRCRSTNAEQFAASPLLNLQIVLFLQKTT